MFLLAHDLLRFFRIRPERRVGGLLFYLAQLFAELGRVKDTPEGRGLFSEARSIPVPVLRPWDSSLFTQNIHHRGQTETEIKSFPRSPGFSGESNFH
jgi:hypothetical protein